MRIVASGSVGLPASNFAGHFVPVPAIQNCTTPVATTLAPVTFTVTTTGIPDAAGLGATVSAIFVFTAATTMVTRCDVFPPAESVMQTSNVNEPACVGVPESVPPGDNARPGGGGWLHALHV